MKGFEVHAMIYDRTFEYRADFGGHEFAGTVVARNIIDAANILADRPDHGVVVDVRYLAEVKRTTCCQRGDWTGAEHQPASAYLYVPNVTNRKWLVRHERAVTILPETTADYRWECEYCGRVGTKAELDNSAGK